MTPGWRIRAARRSSSELGFLKSQSNVCLHFGCIKKKCAQNYVLWIWQIECPGFLDSYWEEQLYKCLELGPICTAQPASTASAWSICGVCPLMPTTKGISILPLSLLASPAEEDQGTTCICSCPSSSTSEEILVSVTTVVRGLQLMLPRAVWENRLFLAGRREG